MSYWLYANLSPIWILEHDSSRNKAASTASCGSQSQVLWRSQQCPRTNIIFTEHFTLAMVFTDNSFEQVSDKKFHRGFSASPRVLKNFQVSFISILWPRERLILARCPMPSLISQILEIVGCIARMHTAQKNSFFFPPSNCSRRRGGQQYYKIIRSTEMSLQFTLCTVCISSLRAYTNQILIGEAFFVYDDITDCWFLHRSNIC